MSAETGVIHDIGYRRYTGRRLGRAQIIRALYWHSLRSAFGIGRGAKAKIVPVITFVVICLPAIANAVADLGLPLNRLEQRRRRIEELFRDDQPQDAEPEAFHVG